MPTERLFTRRFASLWLFQFGTFFSAFQLLPVIPMRMVDLGGSKATAGMFLFVYTFASAFAAPITGTIADHIGRRRMLVLASLLFIVFSLLYGVVPWLPVVLVIGVIHGAIWSGILSSASAIMTDFIPASRRTEGLGYWGLAPTAAIAIAPAIGLYVYEFGWLALCVEIAILSAIMAVWGSRIPGGTTTNDVAKFPRVAELWDPQVIRTSISFSVVSFGYGGITSYVALLSKERGIQPESLFFTVFAITIVAVRVLTSRIGDRFGPKVLLYPAFVAMPLAFGLLSIAATRGQMIGAAILFGIGLGASFPAFMTFVVTHTDDARRGRTFGSVILAFDTGIGLGSFVIGLIGERTSLGTAFAVAAVLSCLAIPIFVTTSKRLASGTAVAENAEHAGT
ncbi:MAG TPA: MFS transporter [Thermoanaerobaculia bacterium]|nr:MFS transporter [Thermoanaerobaculia bacterium]